MGFLTPEFTGVVSSWNDVLAMLVSVVRVGSW